MRIYPFTSKRPCRILLDIKSTGDCETRFTGRGSNRNSVFFDRFPFKVRKGSQRIEFRLPISPRKLHLEGKILSGKANVYVKGFKMVKLEQSLPKSVLEKEFLDFAQWIAMHIGYLPYGNYSSSSGRIKLMFAPSLIDEGGNKLYTPARVDIYRPYIEISKSLRDYTIPTRMFILCHEFAHYLHNSFDELQADRTGARLYLSMGFPQSEAFYSLVDILRGTNEDYARMQAMKSYFANV
jgi:hypothetical protein